MHNAMKLGSIVLIALISAACGDDDQAATMGVTGAGTSAAASGTSGSAGKPAVTAGTSAAGTLAAGSGSVAGRSGVAGTSAAGKGGAAGTAGALDEDAGVTAGVGGATALSGSGGSGGALAPSGGSGGRAASGGAGAGGAPASGGAGGAAASGATFTQVYALFKTSCAGATCHVGANRAGDMLSMTDQATAYTNLVGVNAVSCSGQKRVVAGDSNASELVHTLDRTASGSCANTPRMPDGRAKLPQSDIDLVVSWVKAGAPNN